MCLNIVRNLLKLALLLIQKIGRIKNLIRGMYFEMA